MLYLKKWNGGKKKRFIEMVETTRDTGTSMQAMDIFSRAMADPQVMKIFASPAQKTEVWMERSFAYQKEGKMVQGIFDRVVLSLSESDEIMAAEIIDFKTDRPGQDVGIGSTG
jgi:hypothetical protein